MNCGGIILLICAIFLICASCSPAWLNYDNVAKDLQLKRSVISTNHFNMAFYTNNLFDAEDVKQLHVYFDGDGSPWRRNGLSINDDPTPRQHLVLRLMSLDSAPSILIGRPCYHGFFHDTNCSPLLWTHKRYAEKITSAIGDALNTILSRKKISEVVFIGYSGGGTLALLVAEKIPQVRAVITLAGNLDPELWIQLHGYSPLVGSVNPAERPPLSARILQIHYVGRSDINIPAYVTESYISKIGHGEMIILDQVDHSNGWLEQWSNILIHFTEKLRHNNRYSQ